MATERDQATIDEEMSHHYAALAALHAERARLERLGRKRPRRARTAGAEPSPAAIKEAGRLLRGKSR